MNTCRDCKWRFAKKCKRFPGGAPIKITDWCGEFSPAEADAERHPLSQARRLRPIDDVVTAFVSGKCVKDAAARTPAADLYAAFVAGTGEAMMKPVSFGQALGRLGIGSVAYGGVRYRTGIRLA